MEDFYRLIGSKWWYRPEWHWFVQPAAGGYPVGTVVLALRGQRELATAVVHWLAVDPAFRRRGVGRLLLAALEQVAWDAGYREVRAETHSRWRAAAEFYQRLGYRPARAL